MRASPPSEHSERLSIHYSLPWSGISSNLTPARYSSSGLLSVLRFAVSSRFSNSINLQLLLVASAGVQQRVPVPSVILHGRLSQTAAALPGQESSDHSSSLKIFHFPTGVAAQLYRPRCRPRGEVHQSRHALPGRAVVQVAAEPLVAPRYSLARPPQPIARTLDRRCWQAPASTLSTLTCSL